MSGDLKGDAGSGVIIKVVVSVLVAATIAVGGAVGKTVLDVVHLQGEVAHLLDEIERHANSPAHGEVLVRLERIDAALKRLSDGQESLGLSSQRLHRLWNEQAIINARNRDENQ